MARFRPEAGLSCCAAMPMRNRLADQPCVRRHLLSLVRSTRKGKAEKVSASAPSVVSGRCYCGATTLRASKAPLAIAYCHCTDCRRVTGAPVAAFAEFDEDAISFAPNDGRAVMVTPGVRRSFCEACGSPLSGRYGYLPGRVYVALGLLDQANDLAPGLHAHESERLKWLHIQDNLPRQERSARTHLARKTRALPGVGDVGPP